MDLNGRAIFSGGETFASKIANNASEFNNPASTGAYIAAGLVLFVPALVVLFLLFATFGLLVRALGRLN